MPSPKINVLSDGERLEERFLGQLTRLEVRESDSEPTVAALRFNLTQQPAGTFSLLDDERFAAGARLAVELAAPGGLPQRLFDGYVTHLRPHFETIEANCYVEVLGMDAAALLDAQERAAAYPDALDSEAAAEIFDRYQIPFVGADTAARFKADHQLLVQRGTDWQFVRALARRNGYCCYFEYDPAQERVVGHFHKRALDAEPQADLTILRQGENLEWVDLQLVLTGPVRHRGAAIDPLRKRIVRSTGEPEEEELGERTLADEIEEGLTAAGVEEPAALLRDPPPMDAAIAAAGTAWSDRDGYVIEARGELDPALYRGLLRARRPVLLKGVGARLSGLYYVRALRTTVDEGRLRQAFVAERNALGQSGREEFGQSAEEVPPQ
ncbi:MAG: hypothetical protein ACRD2T_07605 [Thermoanaerobaculia bacterium]